MTKNMNGVQSQDSTGRRIKSWWASVLAGQVEELHPNHGADLDVAFKGGVLRLSGELASESDRQDLLKEAREYVGRGVDKVDAEHLRVARVKEKPGILDQTLIAAFANRDVAEFARRYLVESRRIEPKALEILDSAQEGKALQVVPQDFAGDVQKALKAGLAVLVLRVDETEAFRVRELLSQETRSIWTVAAPPTPSTGKAG
jgi:hypothetical protein